MYDEKIEKFIVENPKYGRYKDDFKTGFIILPQDKYYTDSEQLKVKDRYKISKQFIIDLLSHDDSYAKLKECVIAKKGITIFFFDQTMDIDRATVQCKYIDFIELLKKFDFSQFPLLQIRYDEILSYVSYQKYQLNTRNNNYEISIDGKDYSVLLSNIYEFMNLSDAEFNTILERKESLIYGIPLDKFIYIVTRFYSDNKIADNYLIGEDVKKRLKLLRSSKIIDIEMLNKHFDFEDYTISQFSVNEELQESILSGLPSDFSDLEKAIYIYIKMCKLFTYDEEFYAVNQKGPLSEKHRLIDNLSNISLTNNKVVCYEFNAIYSYMLNKLKINYRCCCGPNDYKAEEAEGRWYGTDHTFLEFMCDKFLVKADAVTGILHGDIMQAKLNQPLDGLICQNKNEQTKQEFQNSMRKVYGYIAEREPKLTQNEPNEVESFEDIASQFKQLTDKIKPVNLTDKIDILIRKVNDTKMIGVDAYSYLLQLRKILFTKQEQAENVKISIIRNSNSNSATALSVISIIIPDETGEMKISRYLYSPGNELLPISKDDLQEKFDSGVMGYIEEKNPVIPGIRR